MNNMDNFGQYYREESIEQAHEETPVEVLSHMYDKIGLHNVVPHFITKPEGLFYWRPGRIKDTKVTLAQMEEFSRAHNIIEFKHPGSRETINLKVFFKKIQDSIVYSQGIHQRIPLEQQPINEDQNAQKRLDMMERLKNAKRLGEEADKQKSLTILESLKKTVEPR